ncbi:hypothetical protein ANTQUA_LOCUS3853 [Anthophora quadrimaculata]
MNDRSSIDTHTQWKIFYVYYGSTGGSERVNCVHISNIFLKIAITGFGTRVMTFYRGWQLRVLSSPCVNTLPKI